jgi:hypothetical protein
MAPGGGIGQVSRRPPEGGYAPSGAATLGIKAQESNKKFQLICSKSALNQRLRVANGADSPMINTGVPLAVKSPIAKNSKLEDVSTGQISRRTLVSLPAKLMNFHHLVKS